MPGKSSGTHRSDGASEAVYGRPEHSGGGTEVFDYCGAPAEERSAIIERAAQLIAAGELVAFPTETVYGLGGDGLSEQAAHKIFEAKGRPLTNPLLLHVKNLEMAETLSTGLSSDARILARAFWPGPLSLIVPKSSRVPPAVTAGGPSVGLRCPDNHVALALIEACGVPIAAPSANLSGRPSPITARHVLTDLGGVIAAVIDAGPTQFGLESTVLDLTCDPPEMRRRGAVTREEIEEVLKREVSAVRTAIQARPRSLRYCLVVTRGSPLHQAEAALREARRYREAGRRVALLLPEGQQHGELLVGCDDVLTWSFLPNRGQDLYSLLRELEDGPYDVVISLSPGEENGSEALCDRLAASAERVVWCG